LTDAPRSLLATSAAGRTDAPAPSIPPKESVAAEANSERREVLVTDEEETGIGS